MNPYIACVKSYLADHKPNFGCRNVESLLDMLFYLYVEQNPMHNEKTHALFAALDRQITGLILNLIKMF